MTPQSSASFRMVTSLLTDRRLKSLLSGAALTTRSLTRSKLWRWWWTSGETALLSPHSPSWTVTAVESFRFLGTTISQDLKWDNHIESIVKEAQQRLYFLCQLRNFNQPQEFLEQFYSAIIESVLWTSMTVWLSKLLSESSVQPSPLSKNCTYPEWAKRLAKFLWEMPDKLGNITFIIADE